MKHTTKRAISFLIALCLLLGLMPVIQTETKAASNMANSFDGQDSDVFSALGFDTSVLPEGYEEDTTDNPYGRDTVLGNQVFEALISSANGLKVYGRDNNNVYGSSIAGMPSSGTGIGMEMYAVASGDFDGDGLPGEVVYVGYDDVKYNTWSSKANLQLRVYDAATNTYSNLKTIGKFNPGQVITSGGTNYSTYDYAWQNLLQVTAGDYDCDGIAEIAVYVADDGNSRVDIFKYQKTSQSTEKDWLEMGNWSRVWSHVVSNTSNEIPNMISLASGDFNRDGVDDLAISAGRMAPYGKPFSTIDVDKSTAVVLWGGKSDMLQNSSALDLNEDELGELTRVSLVTGDLDGDGTKELIATGQPISDVVNYYSGGGNTTRSITTYIYDEALGLTVNYSGLQKPLDGQMVTEEGQTGWQSGNGFDQYYRSQPLMRTNAAAFRPEGSDYTYLYLDSCMYEYAEGQLNLKIALDDANYDGSNTLGGDGVWGSANIDPAAKPSVDLFEALQPSLITKNYMEYGAVAADINGDGYDVLLTNFYRADSLCTDTASHFATYGTLYGSSDGTLDTQLSGDQIYIQASETEGESNTLIYSSTSLNPAALAMVDVDLDTVIIEYTGIHYLTYSDPEVLAIIAAAPYFEDVDIISNYDYAWQNTTSYSRISGGGKSDLVAVDLEFGAYVSTEKELGGGKFELETSLNYTLEWEQETTKTTEYTLSFETSQNEDAVAFFCIPTENYVYKIYTPDGNGGYKETVETISNTFTPCYQILTLDYYESIQGNYDALPQISGVAITSTPGDPSSYPSSSRGYDVIAEWNDDPAGVSFGNGSITQEITITEEEVESYNMGVAWDFQIGGGVGAQSDIGQIEVDTTGGFQWSLNPTGGWANINLEGTSISGTVTNMPLDFQNYGYYYTWKLFAYNYKFDNGNSIPVVSYVVGDISEPPQLPEDFQQDYDRTTSDKNVLTWTYDGNFSNFYIYKYYDFPVGGGLQQIAEIPSSTADYTLKYDSEGKPYKEYYFEDENLSAYTEYEYAIQVERLSKVPPLSAPSGLLTARTKAADGYPIMTIHESDNNNDRELLVYPDKTSHLTLEVTGPEGQTSSNYYTTVQYQWQKQEKGAWVDITGETYKTLTFAGAGVDTAGTYRCRVNVLTKADATAITAYTETIALSHAKRTSYIDETTLGVTDVAGGGVQLYAQVRNAHSDSASIPTGTVTFTLTNNATGSTYQYFIELDANGIASEIIESPLPEGMYSVYAYYSGSYIFKASSAQCLYLSQRTSGYDVDAPASTVYGEGAEIIFRQVDKSGGITSTTEEAPAKTALLRADLLSLGALTSSTPINVNGNVVAGKTYCYTDDGIKYYFTASRSGTITSFESGYAVYSDASSYLTYSNTGGKCLLDEATPAGSYAVKITSEDNVVTYATVVVTPRPIVLQLPTQKGAEGQNATVPTIGELPVVSGDWAQCDLTDGVLSSALANKAVSVKYYNTAGTAFTNTTVDGLCGFYTIRSTMSLDNYAVTFLDGSITILGAAQSVGIGVRPFEGKDVGTLYVLSPEYDYTRAQLNQTDTLVQKHQTGTRLVFTAVPDEGYEIYDWYVNGVKQNSKSSSFSYVLLNESTTVEVQYAVKQNSISFGIAGDTEGGRLVCSDPDLTSGSVVLANALFTFTAVAEEGYHFKEWRYTELGNGTVYNDEDAGAASSTFELLMPSVSCSLYAVFERDYYTLTYTDGNGLDGLTAWYMGSSSGDSTVSNEKIYVTSGTSVKGGTAITIEPKKGYRLDNNYRFVSDGSVGSANYTEETFKFTIEEDTTIYGWTEQNSYDLTLSFDVNATSDQPVGAQIRYYINDAEQTFAYRKESPSLVLQDIPGGSNVSVEVTYPSYYLLGGWQSDDTKTTSVTTVDRLATLILEGETVVEGKSYYHTYDGANRFFVAPATGTVHFDGTNVTVSVTKATYTITELDGSNTLTVSLNEKPLKTVTVENIDGKGTYEFELPEGASVSENVVTLHEGDDFNVLVTPEQKWTVTYWQVTPESTGTALQYKASHLRYTIPNVTENFGFKPIFATTTYNTVSWPTISESQNNLVLSEYNCLASVAAGGNFQFKLSGGSVGLIDTVYGNGNAFTTEGNTVGTVTYRYDASTGIYSIENIHENQTITVDLKKVGVTVSGVDISSLTGVGWAYDTGSQILTLNRANLTVSGKNDTTLAPNFAILMADTATSITLNGLNISTAAGNLINAKAADVTITVTGSNTLTTSGSNANASMITGTGSLTFRGNGNLTVNGTACYAAVRAEGDLNFLGNARLNIVPDSSYYTVMTSGKLVIGNAEGTSAPTLRISQNSIRSGIGLQAENIEMQGGELAVSSMRYAISCSGNIDNYSGIMELRSETGEVLQANTNWSSGDWNAHYDGGYMLRYADSLQYTSADPYSTYTKLSSSYSSPSSGLDVLAQRGIYGWISDLFGIDTGTNIGKYQYVRLSPLDGNSDGDITLSVDYNGKTYSTVLQDSFRPLYYYIDKGSSDTTLKTVEDNGNLYNPTLHRTEPNWVILAVTQNGVHDLQAYDIQWTKYTDEDLTDGDDSGYILSSITPNTTAKYDYALSGVVEISSGSRGGIDASYANVNSLTLDGLTYTCLYVSDAPVYLEGDNILLNQTGAPLNLSGDAEKLDLRSRDGMGTLTLSTSWISTDTSALEANAIELHNVKSLIMFSGSVDALVDASGGSSLSVRYYDDIMSGTELSYGTGWMQDIGTNAVQSSSQSQLVTSNTGSYVKFYSTTTDAAADPSSISFDKGADTTVPAITITEPAINGQLYLFDKAVTNSNIEATGYVQLLDAEGKILSTLAPNSDYTFDGSANKLALAAHTLKALEIGNYTLRVYFYDKDKSDATTYSVDVALTITETKISTGDLSLAPVSASLGRGNSIDLSATFTGTPPKVYEWTMEGNTSGSTLLNSTGANATLIIGADEATGSVITVTVTSYEDESKSNQLGRASSTFTVVAHATEIVITCVGETPSGDGSYTLHHTTADGTARTWDFNAAVTLDSGEPAESGRLSWELWGATLQTTVLNETTGELTIDPAETGINGRLRLTAIYTNEDGTTLKEIIPLYLSSDAYVAYDNTSAENGAITDILVNGEAVIGNYVPAGSTVIIQAAPDADYAVETWYVNGESVIDNENFTVDSENHTLRFTAEKMRYYVITADYISTNAYEITYSSTKKGSLTAIHNGAPIPSCTTVTRGTEVTFTATPDDHCSIRVWYVDGEVYMTSNDKVYTGSSLTLENIEAAHDVRVEFQTTPRRVDLIVPESANNGSLIALVNGEAAQAGEETDGSLNFTNATLDGEEMPYTGAAEDDWSYYENTVADTLTVLAMPDEGYRLKAWALGVERDGILAFTTVEGNATNTYTLPEGIGDCWIMAIFEALPEYRITVRTNSYENGMGKVTSDNKTIEMSSSETFTVLSGESLTLTAIPDAGNRVYEWTVSGCQYELDRDTLTLLNINDDVSVDVKFRRSYYDVTLSTEGSGTFSGSYSLAIDAGTYSGTITDTVNIRGGSSVSVIASPAEGYIFDCITVNGEIVDVIHDTEANTYSYTIDALSEDVEIEAVFYEVPKSYPVTVPLGFFDLTSEGETIIMVDTGTADITFVPDGYSTDLIPDDKTVEIAQGGSAVLLFSPLEGYVADADILETEINSVLEAAQSSATWDVLTTAEGYRITLYGVDTALDFRNMASPFVPLEGDVYYTVTFDCDENGSLQVIYNDLPLASGAKVLAGSEIKVIPVPDAHYALESLTANGADFSETLTVNEDITIGASFAISEYKVTVNVSGTGDGTVEINGVAYEAGEHYIAIGTQAVVTATPNILSDLNILVVDGSTELTTVTVDREFVITAVFDRTKDIVTYNTPINGTLTVLDSSGNPLESGAAVPLGEQIFVIAIPDDHCAVETFTVGGVALTSNSFVVDMIRGNDIYCTFAVAEVPVYWGAVNGSVSVAAMPEGTALTNGQYVPVGTALKVVTTPVDNSYKLNNFSVVGAEADSESGWYIAAAEAIYIKADFAYAGPDTGEYTVEINVSGSGEVSVISANVPLQSGDRVSRGTILTITATPGNGYGLYQLFVNGVSTANGEKYEVFGNTVIDVIFKETAGESSVEGLPYYLNANGDKVFIGFAADLNTNGIWDEGEYIAPEGTEIFFMENAKTFSDINSHWAKPYIDFNTSRELFLGVGGDRFDPAGNMTRAMFATLIGRLYERSYGEIVPSGNNIFTDCNYNSYYGKYVDWAQETGLILGVGNGRFNPNGLITREQMAALLYRFAQFMNKVPQDIGVELPYADKSSISNWAADGVRFCQASGLLQGRKDNTFNPQGLASRAEVATIINRFVYYFLSNNF